MAQSVGGTNLISTSSTFPRKITTKLEVQWDRSSWTDETDRLASCSGSMKIGDAISGTVLPGGDAASTFRATLRNEDSRFSELNTAGALYANIRDGAMHMAPIRFEIGFFDGATPERLRQFTGFIDKPSGGDVSKTITLECMDHSAKLREARRSNAVVLDQNLGTWMGTVADLVDIGSGARTLDTGLFTVSYVWLEDDEIWPELKRIAEADGGRVYFDKSGNLIFENMHHWLDDLDGNGEHTSSQFTFSVSNISELNPKIFTKDVVSGVLVEINAREETGQAIVYSRDDVISVRPNSTEKITALLNFPSRSIAAPVENVDFVTITSGSRRITGDLTFATTNFAQRVELVATNANTSYALYLVILQIRANPLVGGPVEDVQIDSAAGYAQDNRIHKVQGQLYIQGKIHAETIGEFLRDRLEKPKLSYTLTGVPAIPYLELGDRVTVTGTTGDAIGYTLNRAAFITGIDWAFTGKEYNFTSITMVDKNRLWMLDDYFRSGTDGLGPTIEQTTTDGATDLTDDGGAADRIASQHSTIGSQPLRAVEAKLLRLGTPGGRVRLAVWSEDSGLPDAVITGGNSRWVATGDIPTQESWVPFIFPDEPTLAATTTYHLVLESDEAETNGYAYSSGSAEVNWADETVGSGGDQELYDGTGDSWSNVTTRNPAFRYFPNPLFY